MTDLAKSNSLADLAARISAEHAKAAQAIRRGLVHAIAAGEMLVEAKAQIGHGGWLPWLKDHCQIPERTARLYMRLAKNRAAIEGENGNVADLTIRGAVRTLVASRSAADMIDDAEDKCAQARAMLDGFIDGLGASPDKATALAAGMPIWRTIVATIEDGLRDLREVLDGDEAALPELTRIAQFSGFVALTTEVTLRSEQYAGILLLALREEGAAL